MLRGEKPPSFWRGVGEGSSGDRGVLPAWPVRNVNAADQKRPTASFLSLRVKKKKKKSIHEEFETLQRGFTGTTVKSAIEANFSPAGRSHFAPRVCQEEENVGAPFSGSCCGLNVCVPPDSEAEPSASR